MRNTLIYALRFKTGQIRVQPLNDVSLTDEQALALLTGDAQLVRFNAAGEAVVVFDIDDITEVAPRSCALVEASAGPPVAAAPAAPPGLPDTRATAGSALYTDTPLESIRVSEPSIIAGGTCFATLAEFDAAILTARNARQDGEQSVSYVITWKDKTTFRGRFDPFDGSDDNLADRVISASGDLVSDPVFRTSAALTLHQIFTAVMVETRASAPLVRSLEEVSPLAGAETAGLEPQRHREYRLAMSSKTPCYATEGKLRGRCGHKHRDIESAVDCLDADEKRCVALGGHTDREIVFMAPGLKRKLNDDERAAVALYRAESRSE